MASLFTRSFVALLATQACFGFSFSSFFLLPTFMTRELAAGPDDIGRVTACFYVTAVLLGPWMGSVVDRRGRRRFLTAGALLMALVSVGFVAVDDLGPLIFALRTLQGVAFAMAFVAGSALAVDEAPPERLALALGIFGLTMLSNNAIAHSRCESARSCAQSPRRRFRASWT
jgi:MFS family permease